MAFIESPRFPEEVSPWLIGGEEFKTEIASTQGGWEQRNQIWAEPLRRYRLSNAMRTLANAQATKAYFRAIGGRANAFRVKDALDYSATVNNGLLAPMNGALGVATIFQMQKQYAVGALATNSNIKKPVVGTCTPYKNGVAMTTGFTIDYTTGLVTFTVAPLAGDVMRWVGEFDIPVRFDVDWLQIGIDPAGGMMAWDNIQLIEVRV